MMKIVINCILSIATTVALLKALPSDWPIVNKIQDKIPHVIVLPSIKDVLSQSEKPGVEYVVVGECTALFFPTSAPRIGVGNTARGHRQLEKQLRLATFFNAKNVAIFWGLGDIIRGESKEVVTAKIEGLVQIVKDIYPRAEILVVSPYDVFAVTKLSPAFRQIDVPFHLSKEGYKELIKKCPELEKFVIEDKRKAISKNND